MCDDSANNDGKKPANKGWVGALKEFTNNKLVLLVLGAALTGLVVPYINDRRLSEETRLKKALEIVNNDLEFNRQLNSLRTALTTFYFDNRRLVRARPDQWDSRAFRAEQLRFNKEMNAQYAQFDRQVWFWYRGLAQEARILRLIPQDSDYKKLLEMMNEYDQNAGSSVGALGDFWHTIVSPDYDPKLEYLAEKSGKNPEEPWQLADAKLNPLGNARKALAERMVNTFATPGSVPTESAISAP